MKTLKNKEEVRTHAKKTIKNLTTEERKKRQEEIILLLKKNKEFLRAKKVGIYYPLDHEVDLLILKELYPEKEFYFPRTKKYDMDFCLVNDLSELVFGKFNLKEPNNQALIGLDLDVYLVPCLASFNNYRIGHGAGYYDIYFKREKGYKIGIVFQELKDQKVIINNYDIPMDIIL